MSGPSDARFAVPTARLCSLFRTQRRSKKNSSPTSQLLNPNQKLRLNRQLGHRTPRSDLGHINPKKTSARPRRWSSGTLNHYLRQACLLRRHLPQKNAAEINSGGPLLKSSHNLSRSFLRPRLPLHRPLSQRTQPAHRPRRLVPPMMTLRCCRNTLRIRKTSLT